MNPEPAARIDHVLIATVDVERDLEDFRSKGLVAFPGMVFEDGVRNWIVPMKSGQYLELLTAEPDNEAGGWIRACVGGGSRFAGWAVEVPSVDEVADRLELTIEEGVRKEGQEAASPWRTVGEPDQKTSFLPFFITYEWTSRRETPEFKETHTAWLQRSGEEVTAEGISSIALVGDAEQLRSWVGADLGWTVQEGDRAGLVEVTVSTAGGEVVIGERASS